MYILLMVQVMTPSLHCASMLMSLCLRQVTFALQEVDKKESEDTEDGVVEDNKPTVELNVSKMIVLLLWEGLSDGGLPWVKIHPNLYL